MSNDLVPFQQLQIMAKSVAASGLFGVKNQEQALALMLLAQSEKIHPMTAVRDYHLISGRPAMKAEAMLARFQEAGGKVLWITLNDTKAEAEFTCPASPQPLRIEWTIERAQKAGLAGRDIWKAYPRAMLRSRVISEGIRTVMPGVLAGKYTPEETMHIETVEPIEVGAAIERIGHMMLQEAIDEHLAEIKGSKTLEQLRDSFNSAFRSAKQVNDEQAIESFKLARDSRLVEIKAPAEPSEEPQE